jgi:hypothetical protein
MYNVRVVLHEASWADYVKLADNLALQGITDVLVADDGRRYKMTPGDYNYTGTATQQQVFNSAQTAANSTGKRNAVVVSQVISRTWAGLPLA